MRAPEVGEAVLRLPWLAPASASLAALARPPAAGAWPAVRFDPAAVLLLIRESAARPVAATTFIPGLTHDPAPLRAAAGFLERDGPGFVDWSAPPTHAVHEAAVAYARAAHAVASETGLGEPEAAWSAGLLCPLGHFALAAVEPGLNPADLTRLGLEPAAVARRLARIWDLPRWLAALAGHLDLPPETARELGADPVLFGIVRLGVALVSETGGPPLVRAASAAVAAKELSIGPEVLSSVRRAVLAAVAEPVPDLSWQPPRTAPLLRDLLLTAAEGRRPAAPVRAEVEADLDRLHDALCRQHATEETRLRTLKLEALAELAAGAGHEINNPLAVISGQAQYLHNHEADPARRRALDAIISQAARIHGVLQELMHFARPPRPKKEWAEAADLAEAATAAVSVLAQARQVALTCEPGAEAIRLYADRKQLLSGLAALLRNAVDAAGSGGWARVRVEATTPGEVAWVVEDSGPGPAPDQLEHLFDPFYSGRVAGRGRGLGLPTAWRLARQHGGDVSFATAAGGPTRFVLRVPRGLDAAPPEAAAALLSPAAPPAAPAA